MTVKEKTKQVQEAQELLKIITLELETLQLKRNTASPEIVRNFLNIFPILFTEIAHYINLNNTSLG